MLLKILLLLVLFYNFLFVFNVSMSVMGSFFRVYLFCFFFDLLFVVSMVSFMVGIFYMGMCFLGYVVYLRL